MTARCPRCVRPQLLSFSSVQRRSFSSAAPPFLKLLSPRRPAVSCLPCGPTFPVVPPPHASALMCPEGLNPVFQKNALTFCFFSLVSISGRDTVARPLASRSRPASPSSHVLNGKQQLLSCKRPFIVASLARQRAEEFFYSSVSRC